MTVARFANAFFRCSRSRYLSGTIAMARTSSRRIARRGRKRTPQTLQPLPPRYGVAASSGIAARGRPNEEGLPLRAAGRSRSPLFLANKNRELVARKDGRAKRDHRR